VTRFLTTEDLLDLVVTRGVGPVRDLGLLESAVARPRASVFGQDAYPDDPTKAAALTHSVVRDHPLVDGNKRLGWLTCVVFLDINGLQPDVSDEEAFELTMDVARGAAEVADIVRRLRPRAIDR
jgi:death on curing protein